MPAQSGVQLLKATTTAELHEIYRFRYKIYVQEMHRMQHYANHELKEIVDPLDCGAVNFFAAHQTKTIGILRINFCRWSEVGYYETLYAMHTVGPDHPEHTSICTRLMIIPELRGSTLAVRMCILAYTFGLARGIKHNFIDCNDHLVPFFSSLRYVAHTPKTTHP